MHNTLGEFVGVRLRALMDKHQIKATQLSKEMGRAPSYLSRKLEPQKNTAEERELTIADVDAILRVLKEPLSVMLAPVLATGDREILSFIGEDGRTMADIWAFFKKADKAMERRLLPQGLVEHVNDRVTLTPLGRSCALAA